MLGQMFQRAVWRFVNHPASDSVKLAGLLTFFIGFAGWSVSKKRSQKAGEGLLDSEKPQSLRNETERTLEDERAALEAMKRSVERA